RSRLRKSTTWSRYSPNGEPRAILLSLNGIETRLRFFRNQTTMDATFQHINSNNAPRSGRRAFLRWFSAIFGTIAAAFLGVPVVEYFLGLRKRSVFWVDLGAVADYPL